jgi:hypothetical protein
MDSGYFDDDIFETIECAGCQYLIKGKEYPHGQKFDHEAF